MEWNIPGTALRMTLGQSEDFRTQLESVFMMGGVSLGQIVTLTGLEPYQIQNWVRRGYLAPPENKRYTLRQLCRILNINLMKNTLTMESICSLLSYINGRLDDERDDLIDDTELYFLFLKCARKIAEGTRLETVREEIRNMPAPKLLGSNPDAAQRIRNVLEIMVTAWRATVLRQQAEALLEEINKENVS